jgi:hypothetical protein
LARADAEALRILRDAGITEPPVDVNRLAKTMAATIHLDDLDPEVSGLLYRRPNNTVIAVNRDHADSRRRFTIAHELGHLRLHEGRPLIVDHVVRVRINARDHRSSLATDREEIEANRFAAALLMPPDFVEAQVQRIINPDHSPDDRGLVPRAWPSSCGHRVIHSRMFKADYRQ